jgi:hypothetical protein
MASGASFSVATTVFVSLAICAVISYGVFYYFKQRISVIEQSQMEQARVMQAFIARSIMHQHGNAVNLNQMNQMNQVQEHPVHKEVNITESGLIEVSSDSESESDDSESESSTTSESSDNDSGDESESETTKHIQIQLSSLLSDDAVVAGDIDAGSSEKKIISLNKTALGDDTDDDESESDDEQSSDHEDLQDVSFELKIGYKNKDAKDAKDAKDSSKIHLNYGNMSVPALRQLAKERGLGGEDADLHKLKKKDLMQLLQ